MHRRNDVIRRSATQIIGQLPYARADALGVLDVLREMLDVTHPAEELGVRPRLRAISNERTVPK